MNILLTGIGGFLGTHVLEYLLAHTDWNIVGIESFRNKDYFTRINANPRVKVYNHDLIIPINLPINEIDCVVNLASDSDVQRSVLDPIRCWKNNCGLIGNILEFARELNPKVFIQISTNEVYGPGTSQKEWDVILPETPYASSKAAQEALSISYWKAYDFPLVIANCQSIIGEHQPKERFLPKLIQRISSGQKVQIYGEPGKIGSRIYIHANNIADFIIFISQFTPSLYQDADRPDRYNVVGDKALNNLEMAELVAKILNKPLDYEYVPSATGDKTYGLNGTKLKEKGWKQPQTTLESIEHIIRNYAI